MTTIINHSFEDTPLATIAGTATASTVNIAAGVSGNTVSIANGVNTSAQTVNIANGNSGANSTVSILGGAPSTGTQTVHILDGTSTGGTQTLAMGNIAQAANSVSVLAGSTGGFSVTAGTATNAIKVTQTGGNYQGKAANTAPAAGFIGEQIRSAIASGSAQALTDDTAVNVTNIALTAGIWDVSGAVTFTEVTALTLDTAQWASISTTSATLGTDGDNSFQGGFLKTNFDLGDCTITIPAYRLSLSGNTTAYLVAQAGFTGGTISAYGRISATRVA